MWVVTVLLLIAVVAIMFAIKIPVAAIFVEAFRYAHRTPWWKQATDKWRERPRD
jgi:ABC-type sulfate transport system permease subunit